MDVCDPGQDMKNIRKLVLVHTGKKIKINRDEVCEIFRSANLGKLPLPPLGITKDKRYLMDAKSQLTQNDYEVLFSSSSVSAEIKRLAKKVGLINVDKSINELKTAIGRRLHGMKVREPVKLTGGARAIKRASTTNNNVNNASVNNASVNNASVNNASVNNASANNASVKNASANNASVNNTNRNVSDETPSTNGIKVGPVGNRVEPSVNIRNNANNYRKQASNALIRRRRESAVKLIQGATTVNAVKNTSSKRSVFSWMFDGSKKNGNTVTPSTVNQNSTAKFKQLQNSLNKKQRELEQQQTNQTKKIQNARNEVEKTKAVAVANATNESRRAASEAQKKLEEAEATAKEITVKMNTVKANAEVNKAAALKQAENNKNAALKQAENNKNAALKQAGNNKNAALKQAGNNKAAALKQAENNKNAALKQAENNKNAALKEANAAKNKAIEEVKLAEKEAAQAATAEERAEAAEKLKKAQENVTQAELNKTAVIEKVNGNMQKAKNLANKKIELSRLAANAGVNISNKINAINANTNINALRTEIQNKKSTANANLKNKRQTQLSNLLNSSNALNNQAKMGFLQRFEKGENFNTLMNSARKNIKNKSNTNLKNKQQSHLSNLLNSSNVLNSQMKVKYLQDFEKGTNFNTLMNSIRKNIKANSNAKLVNAQQKAANANVLRESLNAAKVNLETEKAASQTKINEATEAARVAERAAANANSANEREKAAKNLQNAQNKLKNVQEQANQTKKNLNQAANNAQAKRVKMMEKLINNSTHLTNANKITYTRRFSEGEKIKDLAEEIREKLAANQQKALNNAKTAANSNKQKALNNAQAQANTNKQKALNNAKAQANTNAQNAAQKAANNARAEAAKINGVRRKGEALKNVKETLNRYNNTLGSNTWPKEKQNYVNTFNRGNKTKNQIVGELEAKKAQKVANNAEAAKKIQNEANAKKAANNAEAAKKAANNAEAAKKAANNAEAAKKIQNEANAKKAANNAEAAKKIQNEANAKKAANNAEAAKKIQNEANAKKAANNAEAAKKAQNEANAKKAANNAEAAKKAQNEANAKKAANNAEAARKAKKNKNANELSVLLNSSNVLNNQDKVKYLNSFEKGANINSLMNTVRSNITTKTNKRNANAEAARKAKEEANAEAARKAKEEANAEAARKAKEEANAEAAKKAQNEANAEAAKKAQNEANTKKAANNAEAAKKAQNEANAKKAANNAEAAKKAQNEANAKKAANNAEAAKKAQNEANAKKAANNAEAAKKVQNEANAEAAKKVKKNKNTNELSVLLNSSNVLTNKDKVKYLNSFEKGANFNTLLNTVKVNIKTKTNKRNANAEAANEANATAAMEKLNKNTKLQGNKNRKTLLKLFETTKINKKESDEYINAFEKGRQTFKEIKEDIVMKAKRNSFGRKLNSKPTETVNNNAEMKASATLNDLNVKPKRNTLMEKAKKEVAQIGGRIGKWGNAIKGANTLNKVSNLNKKLNKKSELRDEIKISKLGPINKTGHRVKIMQLENNVGARRRIFEQQLTNLAQKNKKKELSTHISRMNISKANKNGYNKQIKLPNANLNMIRASANKQVSNKTKVIDNPLFENKTKVRVNPLFENNGEISAAALAPVKNKVALRLGGRAAEPRPPDGPRPNTLAPRSFKGVVKNMREKKVMNGVRVAAKIAKNQKELSEATGAQRIQLARQQRATTNRTKGVNTTTAASLLTTSSPTKSRQQRRMNEAATKKVAKQANTKKRLNNQATRAKALKALKRG